MPLSVCGKFGNRSLSILLSLFLKACPWFNLLKRNRRTLWLGFQTEVQPVLVIIYSLFFPKAFSFLLRNVYWFWKQGDEGQWLSKVSKMKQKFIRTHLRWKHLPMSMLFLNMSIQFICSELLSAMCQSVSKNAQRMYFLLVVHQNHGVLAILRGPWATP